MQYNIMYSNKAVVDMGYVTLWPCSIARQWPVETSQSRTWWWRRESVRGGGGASRRRERRRRERKRDEERTVVSAEPEVRRRPLRSTLCTSSVCPSSLGGLTEQVKARRF